LIHPKTIVVLAVALVACAAASTSAAAAVYRNPILYADYSDPDVIRAGDRFYMVASTFHFSPGIPVLESRDLVHWRILGHAISRLDFDPAYDLPGPLEFTDATDRPRYDATPGHRYSSGVWAPSIRFHRGRFYIFFATPTEGVFMTSARKPQGPWEKPVKVISQAGLEDPCPFWDDDGKAYLVHARVGAGPLILRRMSADGRTVLDAGQVIVDEPQRLPVLEGPKLLKRNGYYYIFAPYGGVSEGPQAVLRSRNIYGPYDIRTVLSKGTTHVQAPHQGGHVETPSGQGWFIHFNSTGAYGRIVHLQPVRWEDDWPIMGEQVPGAPHGQPVVSHAMPDVGGTFDPVQPQTSDEFTEKALGVQWEWNHNPVDSRWSLRERPGYLRLKALPAANLVSARNTLTQVQHGRVSATTARLALDGMVDGQKAGLAMFGRQPSWIGVVQRAGERRLTFAAAGVEITGDVVARNPVLLRMHVADELVQYSYSLDDGKTFHRFGSPALMRFSWWKGARPALFTFNVDPRATPAGVADFDWIRVRTVPMDSSRIDRHALVTRHNPTLTQVDPASPLMVGNGNIAFTADITGLQTFQEQYSPLVPLMTQAQWAWHTFPNAQQFRYEDSLVALNVRGTTRRYPWLRDWSEAAKPHIAWLRENPHRFSLGRLALHLVSERGEPARFADLTKPRQTLDLWSGALLSRFEFEGHTVQVETRMHPDLDMLMVTLSAPRLAAGRLGVVLKFPGVAASLNPDPADWQRPDRHRTTVASQSARQLSLERQLDDTRYAVKASADQDVTFTPLAPHTFRITPSGATTSITVMVLFTPTPYESALPDAAVARAAVTAHWQRYWTQGGMVDFAGSTDPRARELERRVVLSQYLMALNGAGRLPPQEEGLFSNSWNGKFHLEMHPWHSAHFALWGRGELLERSMPWYLEHLPQARERARSYGVRGAWWPKMVGPEGRESPSTITPFIMWQQPHPIYLAELLYRAQPSRETLARYQALVFETAELLASFVHFDSGRGEYMLGPPVIPAQEVFPPRTTFNPAFELAYFRYGLMVAQAWRERLGLAREARWDRVLAKLAPLPQKEGLYLATESFPQLWEQARSAACSGGKTAEQCWNRDHPSFLGALGFLPGNGVDRETMRRTLRAVETDWDLRQTWGWDYPLTAMTAARLHEPDKAIDFLLYDAKNNQYGLAGMTPRVHLAEHAATLVPSTGAPDGPGYRRAAETYFPSNGGLLLAVALMAAGWDGESTSAPGFPKDGRWHVRTEGLQPLP
jgi:beta-xylosidase